MRDQSEESHPTRVYALKWTVFLLAVVQKANGGMAARIREKALSLSAASLENQRKSELFNATTEKRGTGSRLSIALFIFPFFFLFGDRIFSLFCFFFSSFLFSFFIFLR